MPGNVSFHVVDVDAIEAEVDNVDAGPLEGEEAALGVALTVSWDYVSHLDPLRELAGFHIEHKYVGLALREKLGNEHSLT